MVGQSAGAVSPFPDIEFVVRSNARAGHRPYHVRGGVLQHPALELGDFAAERYVADLDRWVLAPLDRLA